MKNNLIEIWKDIPKYEGLYQISNYGQIKSLDRKITLKYKNIIKSKTIRSRILKSYSDKNQYLFVHLYKNGIKEQINIARLVLTIFNRAPKYGEQACHFPDPNPHNNRVDNLIWGTQKINESHKIIHGTKAIGDKLPQTKLSKKEILEIRQLITSKTQKELANLYKTTQSNISGIINKKKWKHVK